jgi:hypothetical protein
MSSATRNLMLRTEPYGTQVARWPTAGRVILAQYDDESIVVYQAYRPSIGLFAAANGYFGGAAFSYSRMSWIKPNFLWMMYRSGWGTKPGQEVVLAIRLRRTYFDAMLAAAVPSSQDPAVYADQTEWQQAVQRSSVRLQWDPDHAPSGAPVQRRAIQLGLRGASLDGFRGPGIVSIEDVSAFVAEQRDVLATEGIDALIMPSECPYPVDASVRLRLGL